MAGNHRAAPGGGTAKDTSAGDGGPDAVAGPREEISVTSGCWGRGRVGATHTTTTVSIARVESAGRRTRAGGLAGDRWRARAQPFHLVVRRLDRLVVGPRRHRRLRGSGSSGLVPGRQRAAGHLRACAPWAPDRWGLFRGCSEANSDGLETPARCMWHPDRRRAPTGCSRPLRFFGIGGRAAASRRGPRIRARARACAVTSRGTTRAPTGSSARARYVARFPPVASAARPRQPSIRRHFGLLSRCTSSEILRRRNSGTREYFRAVLRIGRFLVAACGDRRRSAPDLPCPVRP